jgi:CDP-glucose 4,6-dehydratase
MQSKAKPSRVPAKRTQVINFAVFQQTARRRAEFLVNKGFWVGRRVLLSGHTGFKGSWLALWLQRLGAQVHGFALPPDTRPALLELARVGDGVGSTLGDLLDRGAVRAAVEEAKPQVVLHLVAQSLVRRSISDPVGTMARNVLGTVHLLKALRGSEGLSAVLIVTSDKVYANNERGEAFVEHDRLGGKDPYSASKAAAEFVAKAYAKTFFAETGIRVATARGGNVTAGGDYSQDRIVPDIVRGAERGEKPVLRMPAATRPWQHVLDCLAGYLIFVEALDKGKPVPRALNFGPEPSSITVSTLAKTLLSALGQEPAYAHQPLPKSIEMRSLAVDASLARSSLGWRDRLPGEASIVWTADWYRAVRAGQDPREVTLAQIDRFNALS